MSQYLGHIPTNGFQKLLLAVGSPAIAILNPARGDMVASFGEVTARPYILRAVQNRMNAVPEGRDILVDRPRIRNKDVDVAFLGGLPRNTLGAHYHRFLQDLQTTPDERPPVQFVDDVDLAYIMQRYRETHDLYHCVLEMPTTILGEVAVKWWEALQIGLPMAALGGIFGAARLRPKQRQKFTESVMPYILRNASKSQFFMTVYWEKYWEMDIGELRKKLNIDEPPEI